ncbi:MAG: tetratricopeptide repeat protein [Myxococcota bacterium]
MTTLDQLQKDLQKALELGDLPRIAEVRRSIVAGFPESEAAAEAHYKLGLNALFLEGDLGAAIEAFRAAAKLKSAAWNQAARTSLGIALLREGKPQQAVFELRKAASQKPPNLAAVQALSMVVSIFRQEKNAKEADRARAEQIKLLEQVAAGSDPASAALATFFLGVEHKFDGQRELAKKTLQAALAKGLLEPGFKTKAEEILREL